MWQTGTSTDRLNLLTQLRQIATSNHVSAAAINAAGSGYAVGNILSVNGGTSTHTATIEVMAVSSGAITSVRISTGGAYTVNPTTTANAVTGGSGTGATFNLTMTSTGWTVRRESQSAVSATVAAGGTGYAVGNLITLSGGLGIGSFSDVSAAVFQVATVSSGVVTGVTLVTAGSYQELPTTPTAVPVTGGAGSGCTLNVTFGVSAGERVLIMDGAAGGGGDPVTVGIYSYSIASGFNTATNWALFGMTEYVAGMPFHQQPNLSPGLEVSGTGPTTVSVDDVNGCFVPLKINDGFPMEFWFSITDRRIVGIVKVEDGSVTHYVSFYLGFLNQYGTSTERPYPIYVAGSSGDRLVYFAETPPQVITGLVEMYTTTTDGGPGYYLNNSLVWIQVFNGTVAEVGGTRTGNSTAANVYPYYNNSQVSTVSPDSIVSTSQLLDWSDLIQFGAGLVPTFELRPTPGSPSDLRILVPTTVLRTDTSPEPDVFEIVGDIDGVYWLGTGGAVPAISSEDSITDGLLRYRIFQQGNKTGVANFMAVLEA